MRRILAVDDNVDILEVLKLVFEDSGYQIDTLANGHQVFEKIKEQKPDVILLDIMLGDMDGRELCQELKSNFETNDIPVILISASHNVTDTLSYNQQGGPNAFIAKPFDITHLINTVERQLAA
jgi:CheY-like chemotaxis protein